MAMAVLVASAGSLAHAQEPARELERENRRSLRAFPVNLGRSVVGVFSKSNLLPFAVGATFAGAAYTTDERAQNIFGNRETAFGKAGSRAGGLGVMAPLTIGMFAVGQLSRESRLQAFSYDVAQAVLVSSVYTNVLKQTAQRTRPDGSNNLSFPSGHTSNAFAWATVAQKHYGWKAGVPSYLAAGAIGLSRVESRKHHLSDVLAGATLGVIAGRTVVRENGATPGRGWSVSLTPARDAQGSGAGLGASVSW